jgi:glycosyltransferase involved in cell wall biosynthesis
LPSTLHIDTGREMRGGQWQALYLLQSLAAAGDAPVLMAPAGSPLLEHARARGMEAHALGLSRIATQARRYDLVHAHDARAHTIAAIAARTLVVSRRVAFPVRSSAGSRWKYGRATRYIAVSNFVKGILKEAGIDESRIDVVYDGVPPPPEQPNFDQRTRVVALDSNDPRKGGDLIRNAASRAGIDVLFSTDLPADLKSAMLFVYVSESEGLGSAALLAMAAGVPVLASAVGGLPEIVRDGVTGSLVENCPQQIADNMLKLVRDRALLERLGKNGRMMAEQEFTTARMAAETMRVYEKALA